VRWPADEHATGHIYHAVGVGCLPGPPVTLDPLVGSHRDNLQGSWRRAQPPLPRQRFLRLHAVLSALLTLPFLLCPALSLISFSLILTFGSYILILFCSLSDQGTSERTRSVKIIRR
jgi:hypothetical protein